jgi:hypothetical protein
MVAGELDGVVKQSGQLSWDAARNLIRTAANLRRVAPYSAEASAVLGAYIAVDPADPRQSMILSPLLRG